jgi:hypothetical protein
MQVWQYQEGSGGLQDLDGQWCDFREEQQAVLRRQFRAPRDNTWRLTRARFTMTIGNNWRGKPNNYSIDLIAQTQASDSSSTTRAIRRREADRWTCTCTTVHWMDCRVCPVCGKSRAGHLEDLPESAPAPLAPPDFTASGRTPQLLQSLTDRERRYVKILLVNLRGTLVNVHLPTGTMAIALPGTHSSPTVSDLQHGIARALGPGLGGTNQSQRDAYRLFVQGEREPQLPGMPLDSSREYFCLIEGTRTRKPAFDEISWSRLCRELAPGNSAEISLSRHHPISTGFDQPLLLIDTEFDELTDTTAAPGRFFGQLGLRLVFNKLTGMARNCSRPRSDYYVTTSAGNNRDAPVLFLRRCMADFGGDRRLAWHIGRVKQQEYGGGGSRTWGCCLRCDDTAEDPRDITGPWQMFNPHTGASSGISMMLLSDAEDAAQCDTPLEQQQRQRWQERNRRPSTFWEVQNEQLRRQEEQLRRQEETARVGWRLRSAGRQLFGLLMGESANVNVPV